MQFILFLLVLFAIACLLYGLSAGVQTIQRALASLAGNTRHTAQQREPLPPSLSSGTEKTADPAAPEEEGEDARASASDASPTRHGIDELRKLFLLYQQGALTQEEFESMKRYLPRGIQAGVRQEH